MSWIKKIDTPEGGVTLVYNAMTYIIYKNYTGRDMVADLLKIGLGARRSGVLDRVDAQSMTVEKLINLPPDDSAALVDLITDPAAVETYLYITAALIATAKLPARLDFDDIICNFIPDSFATDPDWLGAVADFILESGVTESAKKKPITARFPPVTGGTSRTH